MSSLPGVTTTTRPQDVVELRDSFTQNGVTFIGKSYTKSADTDLPVWQITKIAETTTRKTVMVAADGKYNQIWDDRATLFDDFPVNDVVTPGGDSSEFSTNFDGVDEYAVSSTDTSTMIQGANPFTISVWIKQKSLAMPEQNVFCFGSTSFPGKILGITDDNRVKLTTRVNINNPNRRYTGTTQALNDLDWHHVVAVKSGGTVTFYVDGVADTPTAAGNGNTNIQINNNAFLVLGASIPSTVTLPSNIHLDEVSYWSLDLTPAQVAEIYNSGVPNNLINHSQANNLVHWYRMGDGDLFPVIKDQLDVLDLNMVNMEDSDFTAEVP
jgi:hypothetical protein